MKTNIAWISAVNQAMMSSSINVAKFNKIKLSFLTCGYVRLILGWYNWWILCSCCHLTHCRGEEWKEEGREGGREGGINDCHTLMHIFSLLKLTYTLPEIEDW